VVEANMFIVTAALPTLRKFFKHVAPRMIGESYGSKPSRTTGPSSGKPITSGHLVTIGSARSKSYGDGKYRKFGNSRTADRDRDQDSDDFVMHDLPHRSKSSANGGSRDLEIGKWEAHVVSDDDSERAIIPPEDRAIVQTRTVVVQYDELGKAV
jgi:hypothetical protein